MACSFVCNLSKKHVVQCFIVAVFTILTAFTLITLAVLYILPEENHHDFHNLLLNMNIADHSLFISIFMLIVCSLWMVSGVLLVVGILKNVSGCVLFFFVYGSFFTILLLVTSLLLLLNGAWVSSFGIVSISLCHICGLVAVYQTYDMMQQGKIFDDHDHDLLVEEESTSPFTEENI